ncbi:MULTISPECIES: glycosyltransferase family 4 protein [unclassified Rhodococcus (in: high G+C Gram-positive bacteria)]|uniref:glycosyltransferase family 4 protein n=1 Tax=unclassified Rhodococcus (in: high G+C Gram-positive bacteria) TaxID=192944 RepID=UPI0034E8DAC4
MVVYVVHQYPVGSQTFVETEWRAVQRAGLHVDVFALHGVRSPFRHVHSEKLRHSRVSTATSLFLVLFRLAQNFRRVLSIYPGLFKDVRGLPRFFFSLYSAIRLAISIAQYPSVHLHAHFLGRTFEVALMARYLTRGEVRVTGTGHAGDVANPMSRARLERCAQLSDAIVCASEFVAGHLYALTGVQARQIVHCGVELSRMPVRQASSPDTILSVGRMVSKKGFDDCVRAAHLLDERGFQFSWSFVGDGPEKQALSRDSVPLEDGAMVEFIGALDNAAVLRLMAKAGVFVLAPRLGNDGDIDGIPVVLMEAMATGCIVISSRIAGIPELIKNGENGFLVEPGSPIEISRAIESVMRNRVGMDSLRENAVRTIESSFSASRAGGQMRDLIDDLWK